jgi:hypothetical protein
MDCLCGLTHRRKTKAAARNKTLLNKVMYHAEASMLDATSSTIAFFGDFDTIAN